MAKVRHNQSLSARRAWIEIRKRMLPVQLRFVALRKESVDRNRLPASVSTNAGKVALRKESVDRNLISLAVSVYFAGRSPQGERG